MRTSVVLFVAAAALAVGQFVATGKAPVAPVTAAVPVEPKGKAGVAGPAPGDEPWSAPGSGYPTTGKRLSVLEPIDSAVLAMMSRHGVPGAALAITKDGKLVCARGYGWANLATREPVQPDTLFGIASLSKTITAAAVLKLVEQGKLRLDDKAFELIAHIKPLPGTRPDPRLRQITVRHLLTHSGGWDHLKSGDPVNWTTEMHLRRGDRTPVPAEYLIAFTMRVPLDFDPGTDTKYSNFGYIVLGEVIEKVSGQSYEKFVREQVLVPAGCPNVRLHPLGGKYYKNEARRYMAGAGEEHEIPAWQQKYSDAAGGWTASAVGMARFLTALDGSRGRPLLGEATFRLMIQPPRPPLKPRPDGTFVGLGWDSVIGTGKECGLFKDGSWFGMRAFMKRKQNGVAWVLLFNASLNPDTTDTKTVGDAVHRVREALEQQVRLPEVDLFDEFK